MNFANGMAMALDGSGLYVVESHGPHVSYVPIEADGSAGTPSIAIANVQNVPDGLAIAPDGTLYISCYEPSRIYRQKPGGSAGNPDRGPGGDDHRASHQHRAQGQHALHGKSRTLAHHRDRSLGVVTAVGKRLRRKRALSKRRRSQIREREEERGALADCALRPDMAAMLFDDALNSGEPYAGAGKVFL